MPKVEGPIWRANQAVVAGSSSASGRPERRKSATSCSFPGFASSRTYNATLTIFYPLVVVRLRAFISEGILHYTPQGLVMDAMGATDERRALRVPECGEPMARVGGLSTDTS